MKNSLHFGLIIIMLILMTMIALDYVLFKQIDKVQELLEIGVCD